MPAQSIDPSGQSQSQTPAGTASGGMPTAPSTCGIGQPNHWLSCIVYAFAVYIPSLFAYMASVAFSAGVELSLQSTSYAMSFVATGWETTRDVANMAFLFIIIYIAIMIMANANTSGNMQLLTRVIVIALLINFSFFGTRVVIDLGNEAAVMIYNILPGTATDSGFLGQLGAKDLTVGIMTAIGPQTLLNGTAFNAWSGNVSTGATAASKAAGGTGDSDIYSSDIALAALYISMGVVLTVVSVAFLVAGIHFVTRMATLWLLIIAAPLACIAYTIPQAQGRFTQWWKTLLAQAIYPACFLGVYMLLLVFMAGISAASTDPVTGKVTGLAGLAAGTWAKGAGLGFGVQLGGAVAVMAITTTLVVVVFKHAMKFAEDVGAASGQASETAGAWVRKNVTGRYAGYAKGVGRLAVDSTVGGAYRQTAGRAALGLDKWASRTWLGNTRFGTAARGGLQNVAAAPKLVGLSSRQDLLADADKRLASREKALRDKLTEKEKAANLALLQKAVKDQISLTDEEKKKIAKITDANLLGGSLKGGLSASDMTSIANLLSKGQMDTLKKSIKYNEGQIKGMTTKWGEQFEKLGAKIGNGTANAGEIAQFQKSTTDEVSAMKLGDMDDARLERVAKTMSKRQAENFEKSDLFSDVLKDSVSSKRAGQQRDDINSTLQNIRTDLLRTYATNRKYTPATSGTLLAVNKLTTSGATIATGDVDAALKKTRADLANLEMEHNSLKELRAHIAKTPGAAPWTIEQKKTYAAIGEAKDAILETKKQMEELKKQVLAAGGTITVS